MGRNEEALAHTDRAIAIFMKTLGPRHPDVASALNNRGEILNSLGRYEQARESFERAIHVWEEELGPNTPTLAYALTGVAVSYLGENKPSNALGPLERAFKVRSGQEVDASDRATTSFALARALWASGRDQARARRLAEEAKAVYAQAAMAREVTAVDTWLRDHQVS